MKKLSVLVLLVCCFLLVGCSLTGTKKEETKPEEKIVKDVLLCIKSTESTINFTTEMSYYFENNSLVNLGVKYVYDLSAYNDEQRKSFAGAGMCETDSIKTSLGMKDCKEELSGTNYIVTGYAEKLFEQSKGATKAIKETYEKDGWKCSFK